MIPGLLKRLQIWALVAKGHKNTNAPLIFENLEHYFFLVLGKLRNGPFLGIFRGGLDFFDPLNCPSLRSGQFRGQKSLGPLEISLEMAHYVVCPQKKIISRIFKISGALIVKKRRNGLQCAHFKHENCAAF